MLLICSPRVSKGTRGVCRAFPTTSASFQSWGWKSAFPSICGFDWSGDVEHWVQHKMMLKIMCCPEVQERESKKECGEAFSLTMLDRWSQRDSGGGTEQSRFLCKELIEQVYLDNKRCLLLLLVLKSFQVLVQVSCVVTRPLKVWVKPSLNLLLTLHLWKTSPHIIVLGTNKLILNLWYYGVLSRNCSSGCCFSDLLFGQCCMTHRTGTWHLL